MAPYSSKDSIDDTMDESMSKEKTGHQMLLQKPYDRTDKDKKDNEKEKDVEVHDVDDADKPRVYLRRWFILLSFCCYSFSNAYQWLSLNIIANVIVKYYNESLPVDSYRAKSAVDMLSMVYMIAYITLVFPATWLLDKKGLRFVCICGSILNAIGAWVKCGSVAPDRFPVLMVAQTICGVAQLFILGIPPRLAAVWFGPNQVSSATSIGVFGNQLGYAIGFLIPPILVRPGTVESMTENFKLMHYITAGFATAMCLVIIIFFRDKPPTPPSRAQLLVFQFGKSDKYVKSLLRLLHNKQFVTLLVANGVNSGSYYALCTLLNNIILHYHEGEEKAAGQIGLTIVLLGLMGSVLAGIWLDKTKAFKGTTVTIFLLTLVGMVAFTFTLQLGYIWIIYLTAGSMGFFMTGYLPVGYEFAAELTYPEPEGTSSGLLNMTAEVFGIIFTLSMRAMMESASVLSANITLCSFLVIGILLAAVIKPDYRRQNAGKELIRRAVEKEKIFLAPALELDAFQSKQWEADISIAMSLSLPDPSRSLNRDVRATVLRRPTILLQDYDVAGTNPSDSVVSILSSNAKSAYDNDIVQKEAYLPYNLLSLAVPVPFPVLSPASDQSGPDMIRIDGKWSQSKFGFPTTF